MQYRHLQMARISFAVVGKTLYQTKVYCFFFKIPKNLITSVFFFAEADTKKHRYASAKCL